MSWNFYTSSGTETSQVGPQGPIGPGMTLLDSQTFTSSQTYTMPAGATTVFVQAWAAGGGGGSGAGKRSAGYEILGGAGGAGGGFHEAVIQSSELSSAVNVTIGAGGAGGNSITSTDAGVAGNPGNIGGLTAFGPRAFLGGGGGSGGIIAYNVTTSAGASLGNFSLGFAAPNRIVELKPSPNSFLNSEYKDSGYGFGGVTKYASIGYFSGPLATSGVKNLLGGGGGGSGGGFSDLDIYSSGTPGGSSETLGSQIIGSINATDGKYIVPAGGGGGVNGGNGSNKAGGGGSALNSGAAGGAGAAPSGGGGGGGARNLATAGSTGAGGAGGRGEIKIWVYG